MKTARSCWAPAWLRSLVACGGLGARDERVPAPARREPARHRRPTAPAASCARESTTISLQLQWAIQAQFAGYIAAATQGFYERYCLDVEIIEAGVDIVPQQDLADGNVDFALAWVPKALATREAGRRHHQHRPDLPALRARCRSPSPTPASAVPEDFEGKNIGNWGFGNEYEIFAALAQAGLDPASDVTSVQQQFDMVGLLDGDIDAAEAMTYNEYAQVLEAENPDTGELYSPTTSTYLL